MWRLSINFIASWYMANVLLFSIRVPVAQRAIRASTSHSSDSLLHFLATSSNAHIHCRCVWCWLTGVCASSIRHHLRGGTHRRNARRDCERGLRLNRYLLDLRGLILLRSGRWLDLCYRGHSCRQYILLLRSLGHSYRSILCGFCRQRCLLGNWYWLAGAKMNFFNY